MTTVCILWFGGHTVVGLHVTVPSLQGTDPEPPVRPPGVADAELTTSVAMATRPSNALLTLTHASLFDNGGNHRAHTPTPKPQPSRHSDDRARSDTGSAPK